MPGRSLSRPRLTIATAVLALAAAVGPQVSGSPAEAAVAPWTQGGVYGGWQATWVGSGAVLGDERTVTVTPKSATSPWESYTGVVTSTTSYGDAVVETTMATTRQLRAGSAPRSWEVGSLITRYVDADRYYAVRLKTTGWELTKHDPASPRGQRVLASGSSPTFPLGTARRVRLTQRADTLTLDVAGTRVTSVRDTERPYLTGRVGLASDNAATTFTDTTITVAPATPATFAPAATRDGLVTNEWAYWNRAAAAAVTSPDWEMDSGSLFARSGSYWSGRPDDRTPDATSSTGTNSAIFRLTSRRHDLRDTNVDLSLLVRGMTTTPSTPAVDWDGIHLFLRYQNEQNLYYASVARRDGHVVLKKKCAGGSSNGGTYYTLAELSGKKVAPNAWRRVGASVKTLADGSVELSLRQDGSTILRAVDRGTGCAPITTAGAVGIRGDNTEFEFREFTAG